MKLCISSSGQTLDSAVDPRFGRAQGFIIADSDSVDFEAVPNPAMTAGGGAGTKASQLIISKGARAVLTGNVGPNAFAALNAAGIPMYTGVTGTVREAIEKFKTGTLKPVQGPSVAEHSGNRQ
jgi:predicted Fe-Mo cluster-binding NifX family protein